MSDFRNELDQLSSRDRKVYEKLIRLGLVDSDISLSELHTDTSQEVLSGAAALKFLNQSRTDFVRPKTYEELLSKLNEDERVWLKETIPQLHKGNYESKLGPSNIGKANYKVGYGQLIRQYEDSLEPASDLDYSMMSLIIALDNAPNGSTSEYLENQRKARVESIIANNGIAFDLEAINELKGKKLIEVSEIAPQYTSENVLTLPTMYMERGTIQKVIFAPMLESFPARLATAIGGGYDSSIIAIVT